MISHDNVTFLARYLAVDVVGLEFFKDRFVSYLPLSHIAAQIIDLFCPLYLGATVYFAQPDALKGTLSITLNEVKPTFFFGVPRVWEKIQEKISTVLRDEKSSFKKSLIEWARKKASERITSGFYGNESNGLGYVIAKSLVLNKIKTTLGLSECKHFYSGAAPTTKDTINFFITLGLPLCEVFGMSEITGPHICGLYNKNRVTSVGCSKGSLFQSKVINLDADGAGELCVNGRHLFMGYLNCPDKTKETFEDSGWLKTGDIAKIDKEGFVYITGRLKELIITAGGENIAPVPIEDNIKSELPQVISNCMAIGDKRKYLTCFITLKVRMGKIFYLENNIF